MEILQKPPASNTTVEWPLTPVGRGFACSRMELPLPNNSYIVLTDLRAVAFAPEHLLPIAELRDTNGSGLIGLASVDWDYCSADGSSWPSIALYGGLGLVMVLLVCLLVTVLMVYCRGERRGRTHVCSEPSGGGGQSGCCL